MKFFLALSVVLLFGGIHCQTVSETLESLGCTTLLTVLTDTGLIETIEGLPEVTLFAPTNEAIDAAGELPGGDALVDILTFHAFAGLAPSSAIVDELQLDSVNGAPIRFNIYNDGGVYTAQGAPIDLTQVDVAAVNGLVHVVNAVMIPPPGPIYQLLQVDPNFSTLLAAVDTAGLGGVLDAPGTLTVFAPDNAAFENVPADVLDDLLGDIDALTDVLLYHVANDTVFAAGIDDGDVVPTLQGDDIVMVVEGGVFINSTDYSQVILPDVSVSNGVVHVINRVLKVVTIDETD